MRKKLWSINWYFVISNGLYTAIGCNVGALVFTAWLNVLVSSYYENVVKQPVWLVYLALAFFMILGVPFAHWAMKKFDRWISPAPPSAFELLMAWSKNHPDELDELRAEARSENPPFFLDERIRKFLEEE